MKYTRRICYILTAVMALGFWTLSLNFADEVDTAKVQQLENQMSNAQSNAQSTKEELKEKQGELKDLNAQIKELENKIVNQQASISTLTSEINTTRGEINTAEQELVQVEKEMEEQNELMGKRLRAMYKSGETSMLEVLLTSENVGDLVSNIYMTQKIMDADLEQLELMRQQQELVEQKKAALESVKSKLENQKAEQVKQQEALQADKNQVNAMKQEVALDAAALEKQLDSFNKEAERLASEIRNLTNPSIQYEGGVLLKPVPSSARETSQFGYRNHPILKVNKLHTGLDYGVPTGTTIQAAASGNVIKSGWNNSYGWVVMIDHGTINGQSMVTVYAHNSQLLVSEGSWVERGQSISLSGSTGDSTGPHLHFEVRLNGTHVNPKTYL